MAYATINTNPLDVQGGFAVPETGAYFEWKTADFSWAEGDDYWGRWAEELEGRQINAEIFMSDGSTRFARVLKTVAYVVVDEDEYGRAVVEKWAIRERWAR